MEYMIYIRHNSMFLLRAIVKPYLCSSMLYKLDNSKITLQLSTWLLKNLDKKDYTPLLIHKRGGVNPY